VRLSARKGILRILGKGEKVREIPLRPDMRTARTGWLDERADWPGADTPVLFLTQHGARLSVKGAHDIITKVATAVGLQDDDVTAHVLRHTFATPLVRGRRTSSSSPSCWATPASRQRAPTADPPTKTRSTRSSSSRRARRRRR
jgi:site-specific recombinase XerC